MRNRKRIIAILFAVIAVVGVTAVATLRSQDNQTSTSTNQNSEQVETVDIAPEPTNGQERAQRRTKNRRYNRNGARARRLTQLPPERAAGHIEEAQWSPLPVAESDFIVLGTVARVQPYLSEDESSIYTEFTVNIEEVLKNDNQQSLYAGNSVVVDRQGGSLRMPDGRVVRYEVSGIGRTPRAGRRYVLFLKRINEGEDLSIIVSYELRGNRVFSLRGHTPYEGDSEEAFMNELRAAIARF